MDSIRSGRCCATQERSTEIDIDIDTTDRVEHPEVVVVKLESGTGTTLARYHHTTTTAADLDSIFTSFGDQVIGNHVTYYAR